MTTSNKVPTIDADGHIMEPTDLWEKYLEPKYRDRALRLKIDEHGVEYLEINGKISLATYGGLAQFGGNGRPEVNAQLNMPGHPTFGESTLPGAVDPHERIKVMDADSIDIAFLYPSLGIVWEQECDDAEIAAAYCRAYNNWMFDFCAPYPDRLKPIAHISLLDVGEAVKEARRVAKLGAKGTFLFAHPPWLHGRPFGHPDNDPYWAELQELNLPAGIHVNLGVSYPGDYMYPAGLAASYDIAPYIHYLFSLDVQIAFTNFIFEGVFERFPRLKILILESGAGWLPSWLDRLDHINEVVYPNRFADRSLRPSEYFQRQCWISMDPDDTTAPWIASQLGADKILWASDYPHDDAYPRSGRRAQKEHQGPQSGRPDQDPRRQCDRGLRSLMNGFGSVPAKG